ncbi:unnamed protein product [Lampetra fluviatilis]
MGARQGALTTLTTSAAFLVRALMVSSEEQTNCVSTQSGTELEALVGAVRGADRKPRGIDGATPPCAAVDQKTFPSSQRVAARRLLDGFRDPWHGLEHSQVRRQHIPETRDPFAGSLDHRHVSTRHRATSLAVTLF